MTKHGRRFLLWDSLEAGDEDDDNGDDTANRILLFASKRSLKVLASSRNWFFDATFKCSPTLFYQLFILHALVKDNTIACVFVLMSKKTQEQYSMVFEKLKEETPYPLQPVTVVSDFELAAISAFKESFPDATMTGCFFHLTQAIWRNTQERELAGIYRENENVRFFVKALGALAFVPSQDVADAFDDLQDDDDFPEELSDLYSYFEATYIGRRLRRGRRAPRYPVKFWNIRSRLLEGLPRTNNQVEGFHRGVQATLDCDKPSIWKCLKFLKNEEALQMAVAENLRGGGEGRAERRDVRQRTQRLLTVATDYENRETLDFLRGVTYNYNVNV